MDKLVDIYPYEERQKARRENTAQNMERFLSEFWNRQAMVLNSARAGYFLALRYFGMSRSDHVLTPDFLCQSMLNITNISGFPVKVVDTRTKAVLLFHQWGYPQDMEKVMPKARELGLRVIEDCAHSFDSTYKGKYIGTFGDVSIYSCSKMFPTYIGGVLTSDNKDLIEYVARERDKKDTFYNKLFNIAATKIARMSFEKRKWRFALDIMYIKSIHFPNIGKRAVWRFAPSLKYFRQELQKRKDNYEFLKNTLKKEYLPVDWNEDIDCNPIAIPVFLPYEKLKSAQETLKSRGIDAEILHFDVNRNIFDSDYRKCLALPCHQQMNKEQLEIIVRSIR